MKVLKILLNIFGILTAFILSLLLAAILLTTPLVSTASSFLKPESLYKVLKTIDFAYFFQASDDSQLGQLNPKLLNELLETEFAEDVITLYVNNLLNALENIDAGTALTPDDITKLADEHITELLPIVKSQIGIDLPLTDEQIQTYAQQYIGNIAPEIASMLPTLGDFGIDNTILTILHNLHSGKALRSLLLVAGILSFLVLLCRFPRFKGFMWLGVTYLCSSLFLFLLAFTVKSTGISLFTELIPISKIIVAPFFSGLTAGVFRGASIILGFAAAFIIIFILGRKLFCQKKSSTQLAA